MNEEREELVEDAFDKLEEAGFDEYALVAVGHGKQIITDSVSEGSRFNQVSELQGCIQQLQFRLSFETYVQESTASSTKTGDSGE